MPLQIVTMDDYQYPRYDPDYSEEYNLRNNSDSGNTMDSAEMD